MAHTGIGATITVDAVVYVVRDMQVSLQRETIDVSSLSDVYTRKTPGRISGTITCNAILDSAAVDGVLEGFVGQTALGTAVTVTLVDSAGVNTYSFSCIISAASHTFSGDDVDLGAFEFTVIDIA